MSECVPTASGLAIGRRFQILAATTHPAGWAILPFWVRTHDRISLIKKQRQAAACRSETRRYPPTSIFSGSRSPARQRYRHAVATESRGSVVMLVTCSRRLSLVQSQNVRTQRC